MTLRVATFNAGLAIGLLPNTTERVPHVVEALTQLDVDLLFVQEFWLDTHWERLRHALEFKLPHVFRAEPVHEALHAVCTAEELLPLIGCAEARCTGSRDEALARCVVANCVATALKLPGPCINCITRHPVGTLDEILAPCIGESTKGQAPAHQSASGLNGLMAYGGSFGTGLMARSKLEDHDRLVFESTINARATLYARLTTAEFGSLHVFAAHLSPGGAEQPPQVDQLLAWVDDKAKAGPALLLGDLNTTPDSYLFERLLRAGFRDADDRELRGTHTHEGLVSGDVESSSRRLDHILVRNLDTRIRTERIFDKPLTISIGGRPHRTTLSDHLGVLATLEP